VADDRSTAITRSRYNRIAPIYDLLEWGMEVGARRWRKRLWSLARPGRLLELGVGTGKNIPHYGERHVTAVDLSDAMLERARRKAERLGVDFDSSLADVQQLPFPDASFDVVLATFLFCSVPDPVLGLTEARRVLVPGGQLLLLEHVLSHKPLLRALMRWLDPIPHHLWGAHIDRDTVDNVQRAGFTLVHAQPLSLDVVQLIEATHA